MSFNDIEIVHRGAFNGANKVRSLYIKNNQLEMIENGALDEMINLHRLDMRNNPNITSYTTNAWHFCTMASDRELDKDSPTFYKNFKTSEYSQQYCNSVTESPTDSCIRLENGIIDCTSIEDFTSIPCNIQNENFDNIIFTYPVDKQSNTVENYYSMQSI